MIFTIYVRGGYLEFQIKTILAIFVPPTLQATCEIWLHMARWFQRRNRLKVWTDDGRSTAFGSGERMRSLAV